MAMLATRTARQEDPDGRGEDEAGGQVPHTPRRPLLAVRAGRIGPQDCGLVYLVMSDPDLRDRLHQIRTASA
jgi:hypothetical protein